MDKDNLSSSEEVVVETDTVSLPEEHVLEKDKISSADIAINETKTPHTSMHSRWVRVKLAATQWFLRLAIASAFLSAVADRFGFWGPPGSPGVAWGNWDVFMAYVAKLNWFVPAQYHGALGWTATIAEIVIAVGVIIGWKLNWFAFAAGLLTLFFGTTMTMALGAKAPLDYSVFVFSAAGFLLAATGDLRRHGDI